MKTTMKITIERTDDGARYQISHEGDRPHFNELFEQISAYWEALTSHEHAIESLPIMKERRKEMKKHVDETGAVVEAFHGNGRLIEPGSDLPF